MTTHPDFDTNILDEAKELVFGARQAEYSHPLDDYGCTAAIVNAVLGESGRDKLKAPLDPQDMMLVMVAVKLSRLSRNITHRDSQVDGCGYLECLHRIQAEGERRAVTKLVRSGRLAAQAAVYTPDRR